jgi:UDP-2,3-diacylglucosamine pyrophosphatase LpxH
LGTKHLYSPLYIYYILYKLQGRSKSSKTCLFISDIHTGHLNAVSSLHPYNKNLDTEINIREEMREVHWHWCKMADSLSKRKIDFLCVNGEPCEGEHRNNAGKGLWSNDMLDQIDDFEKIVKLISYDKFGLLVGSGYHWQMGNSTAEDVVIQRMSKYGQNVFVKNKKPIQNYFANIDINGKLFSITHHLRASQVQSYRSTPPASEASGIEFLRGKLYPHERSVDMIIRGHIHYFWYMDTGHHHILVTPSWKLWDDYVIKKGLQGVFNHIGGVELVIESNGKIEMIKHLMEKYPIPEIIYI